MSGEAVVSSFKSGLHVNVKSFRTHHKHQVLQIGNINKMNYNKPIQSTACKQSCITLKSWKLLVLGSFKASNFRMSHAQQKCQTAEH